VYNEEHQPRRDLAESHESFFFFMKLVPLRESKRIFENGLGQVESNPVLCEILPVLPLVVLESHTGCDPMAD